MATSKERREVAERMRERPVARNINEAYVAIVQAIGVRPCLLSHEGESGDRFNAAAYAEALEKLADLIDPTCHVIPGKEAVAELKDGTRLTGVPLSCGHAVFGVSAKDMPRFCCECGSRITRGGER